MDASVLRPGHVDSRPPDASGRASVRPRLELQPRRPQLYDCGRVEALTPGDLVPQTASVDAFSDLSPRFGAAYDLFGTGKTALKFSGGRYLGAATNGHAYTRNNPAVRTVNSVPRRW